MTTTQAQFKDLILNKLKSSLKANAQVVAAWVGGSTATGFEDSLSDIDIVTICEDAELPFRLMETALQSLYPITQTWKVEDSPFKGLYQKFYILEGIPETFYVDAGVFTSLRPEDYQEYFNTARHGTPKILFDKTGLLAQAARNPRLENPPAFDSKNWQARFEIVYRTFLKESLRGKYIDSFLFYQRLVLMLVQNLRLRHAPQKFDFGFRYLERDLPQDEFEFIQDMLQVSDLESMRKKALLMKSQFLNLQSESESGE